MDELGKGRAEAISDSDIEKLAREIGCHPADLEAIAMVESNGVGWFPDGRIKILFEKHQFYKRLDGTVRTNAVKSGLARKSWISPKDGGYKDQAGAGDRYKLLERAIKVNEEGAYQSVSIGRFQIMGFNHGVCGYISAKQMFINFVDSEVKQLRAFAKFLEANGLYQALRDRNFAKIEEKYNGGGLNGLYGKRMKTESDRLRAGKWKDFGKPVAPVVVPAAPVVPPAAPAPVPPPAPKAPEPVVVPVAPKKHWLVVVVEFIVSLFKR